MITKWWRMIQRLFIKCTYINKTLLHCQTSNTYRGIKVDSLIQLTITPKHKSAHTKICIHTKQTSLYDVPKPRYYYQRGEWWEKKIDHTCAQYWQTESAVQASNLNITGHIIPY